MSAKAIQDRENLLDLESNLTALQKSSEETIREISTRLEETMTENKTLKSTLVKVESLDRELSVVKEAPATPQPEIVQATSMNKTTNGEVELLVTDRQLLSKELGPTEVSLSTEHKERKVEHDLTNRLHTKTDIMVQDHMTVTQQKGDLSDFSYPEEISTSTRRLNEMEQAPLSLQEERNNTELDSASVKKELDSLQNEHRLLVIERDDLQKQLAALRGEIEEVRSFAQEFDTKAAALEFAEDASDKMRRMKELGEALYLIETDHIQEGERDALEQSLLDQIKNAQVSFAQHSVEMESTITTLNSRNEILTDEVTKLRSAFKLVDQANQSHQERLMCAEREAKKSRELLDETRKLLTKAGHERDMLEKKVHGVPGHSNAIDDSMPLRRILKSSQPRRQ
jgi:chromosome segregation ATPase